MRPSLCLAAALLSACATAAKDARPAATEAPPARPAQVAVPASELLMQRVQVALGALGNIEKEWPQYASDEACVLVFGETTEWLFHCPVAPTDDFTPTGQELLGAPVFSGPAVTLGGPATPYAQVKMLVGTVRPLPLKDPKTGLETKLPVFLMQDLDPLSTHHPAFDAKTTSDEWLAIFVHEYFHGYQLFHPKVAQMLGDWKQLQSRENLAPFYKTNPGYQAAVKKEYAVIKDAVAQKPDRQAARAALQAWLTLYRARIEEFGPVLEKEHPGSALEKIDGFLTFLEGVARYEETRFLVEDSLRGRVELHDDPRFKGFADFEGHPVTEVEGRSSLGSEYFYAIGMYVSFLLDVARPSWKQSVMDDPKLLVGEVEAAVAAP